MIFTRTPYRISFFGGGTDYPGWYLENGGQVLSASIDKFCYISVRHLPPFFEHRIRVVYSKIECVKSIEEIAHPALREALRFMSLTRDLEIHHDGDLPARSGIGSSSSFTVGLLNALYALKGKMVSKIQLARDAIYVEQEMIKETVGSQDQVAAAFGGLNHIIFHASGEIEVRGLILRREKLKELSDHLMLFYTGIMRTACDVARSYVTDITEKGDRLNRMNAMVDEGVEILSNNKHICNFGELLNEAWQVKRGLSCQVTNSVVDDIYARALKAGAIGGKITGAGGGGFLLLFVPPSAQSLVRNELSELLHVPFQFEYEGSRTIFYDPKMDDFRHIQDKRDGRDLQLYRELGSLFRKEEA